MTRAQRTHLLLQHTQNHCSSVGMVRVQLEQQPQFHNKEAYEKLDCQQWIGLVVTKTVDVSFSSSVPSGKQISEKLRLREPV